MNPMGSILNQIFRYAFVSQGPKVMPNVSSSFQTCPFGCNIGLNLGIVSEIPPCMKCEKLPLQFLDSKKSLQQSHFDKQGWVLMISITEGQLKMLFFMPHCLLFVKILGSISNVTVDKTDPQQATSLLLMSAKLYWLKSSARNSKTR